MTPSDTPDEWITTDEEFNDALNDLIQTAYANDVGVEGGWECRTSTADPDWDIVILEVTKNSTSEEETESS